MRLVSNNNKELKVGSIVTTVDGEKCAIYDVNWKTLDIGIEMIPSGMSYNLIDAAYLNARWVK